MDHEIATAGPGARWAATPLAERLAVLGGFRHILAAEAAEFGAAATAPGAERVEALLGDVLPLADACRFLEREAERILAPRRLGGRGRPLWLAGVSLEIRREPVGTVLIVGASNYPLLLAGAQVLQALAAGNAVVVKPGRGGGPAARALASGLARAGLPEGVLSILDEDPARVREAIAAGVDKVILTGSSGTGRAVLADLASEGIPSVMELSGCDACIVLPGADLARVVRTVAFGLRFKGSATCIAPRRIIAPPELLAAVEPALAAAARAIPPRAVDPGAAGRVAGHVAEAVARGARLVAGRADGVSPMAPVVVADVPAGSGLLDDDLFAPVVSLTSARTTAEAVAAANACSYALGAAVFGPEAEALDVAARLRCGCVTIGDVIAPTGDPRLPFGGRGASGFGVTRGAEGLLEMTAVKAVAVRAGWNLFHLDPLETEDEAIILGYVQAAHGAGPAARLGAAARLVRSVVRKLGRTRA